MEYENKYASKGVAGAGLGLGIAGTALGVMNNGGFGGLGNLFGGWNNRAVCGEDHCVNRYEAGLQAKISDLESGIALRDANTYNDQKCLKCTSTLTARLVTLKERFATKRFSMQPKPLQ